MAEKAELKNLIIHGHFYQPPRENPWTGRIERQQSASPYHDWNEKITRECYLPNLRSRCLDGYGRITALVNNYTRISFNFGPTLLGWIKKNHPGLHRGIVSADLAGRKLNGGHGNAIAQVYNHMIMPLATVRDQATQIRWGIRDFEGTFSRPPEGIWLAETAINDQTLALLIDFGFRFIILSPHQAEGVRPVKSGREWRDVSNGDIKTGFVYRCSPKGKRGGDSGFINVFFYDAPISQDISFDHLLRNGDRLAEAIDSAYQRTGNDLVTIATDGEVYGHHEPFADMALAHLIDEAAEKRRFNLTNFGSYLDTHPAEFEVRLKPGHEGQGTAWSCSHGVERWKSDCGCNVNPPPGWNQKWRKPLRESLDGLRDELAADFQQKGSRYLIDPWAARDDYIEVISGESGPADEFLKRRAKKDLSEEERVQAFNLLESQKNAMYMFTSCGWFFNDISGLESRQILKYAARAVTLAGGPKAEKAEKNLKKSLSRAKSNVKDAGTGADIYLAGKKYSMVTPGMIAGQFVLSSYLGCPDASPESFGYASRELASVSRRFGDIKAAAGLLEITSPPAGEKEAFCYLLMTEDEVRVKCLIKPFGGENEFEEAVRRLEDLPDETGRENLLKFAVDNFGGVFFSLRDLFIDDREAILSTLTGRREKELETLIEKIYSENSEFLRLLSESSLKPPDILLVPSRAFLEINLSERLNTWPRTFDPGQLEGILRVLSEASRHGIDLDTGEVSKRFSDYILRRVKSLRERIAPREAGSMIHFMDLCSGAGIELQVQLAQNEMFDILKSAFEGQAGSVPSLDRESPEFKLKASAVLDVAARLNFNTDRWRERLK